MKNKFKVILSIFMLLCIVFQGYSPALAFRSKKNESNINNYNQKLDYININWWCNFNDPYLRDYIVKAITNNHNLRKTSWQVEEYRNFVRYTFGKELPTLSVSPLYNGLNSPAYMGSEISQNAFILPFFMRYEADLLAKNRDATKSQQKEYQATQFDEQSAYLSTASIVATAYINILNLDKRIILQKKNLKNAQEILDRNTKRFNRGVLSAIDLNTSTEEVKTSENTLITMQKLRQKLINEFAVLIGESPCNICDLKFGKIETFEYLGQSPQCIDSDVIFSRPDVLAAEKRLEEAKINIRIARKDFFPRFNIIGIYSFNTIGEGNFFGWRASFATLIAAATQDIYFGGRKLANLKIKKAQYEQFFETYNQTNLTAVKEVNDSLYFIKKDTEWVNNNKIKLKKEEDNYIRAKKQFKYGTISYTDLLEKELELIKIEQNYYDSKTTLLVSYLTLYKAVGGKL